jgi:predicted O-methyltransferase YrrM
MVESPTDVDRHSLALHQAWPFDPFHFKRWPKFDPRRLAFVAWSRFQEYQSRRYFDRFEIPYAMPSETNPVPQLDQADTAVTPEQAALLLFALRSTENMPEPIVEVGCYRGVTSKLFAANTTRKFIGVDPFAGYGGAENDFEAFRRRLAGMPNVVHLRQTSGEAALALSGGCLSFVFIDAVHDYVNGRFDSIAWSSLVRRGGLIAFHDTDQRGFAGTRRAVFELLSGGSVVLEHHVENLVIVKKSI